MDHSQCHHLLGDLSDYLDGDVSAEVCAEIERHLQDCENCQVVIDTLHKTISLFHELPQPELSDKAKKRLVHALKLDIE